MSPGGKELPMYNPHHEMDREQPAQQLINQHKVLAGAVDPPPSETFK